MRTEVFAFISGVTVALICATALEHLGTPPSCPTGLLKGHRAADGSTASSAVTRSPASVEAAKPASAGKPATALATDAPAQTTPSTETTADSPAVGYSDGPARKATKAPSQDKPVEPGMLATKIGGDTPLDVTVWYLGNSASEIRFLLDDLIPKAVGGKVTLRPLTLIEKWKPHLPENIINDPNQANILIVTGPMEEKTCNNGVVAKCAYLTPALSILVTDEIGSAKCVERKLSDMTPVVVRHFADETFDRKRLFNVHTVPLGYSFTDESVYSQLPARSSIPKASAREVTWTFIGHRKMDRESMAGKLDTAFPKNEFHESIDGDGAIKAYTKAVFAPSTQGTASHERARLYEASRMGAIPVVVGNEATLRKTFSNFVGMDGDMPPWVIAASWDDAAVTMKSLLDSPSDLDKKQAAVVAWWAKAYDAAAARIRLAVEADYLRRQTLAALGQQWKARGREDVAARFLKPVTPWTGMADLSVYDEPKPNPPPPPRRPVNPAQQNPGQQRGPLRRSGLSG